MPTVEQAFQQFVEGFKIPGDYEDLASERSEQLKHFLKKEIGVNEVFWGGSYRRGTSMDLDSIKLHVVLSPKYFYNCQKNSRKMLNFLRTTMSGEYANIKPGKSGQVLTVKFSGRPHLDLIPSLKLTNGNFLIPNGIGGWFKSNPATQQTIFDGKEGDSSGKFKNLVKTIKVWNNNLGMPFNSYFLELLTYYRANDFSKSYADLVISLFYSMILFLPEFLSCPAVKAPVSLGDPAGVYERIEEAHGISSRALNEKDSHKAIALWKTLLGEGFGG